MKNNFKKILLIIIILSIIAFIGCIFDESEKSIDDLEKTLEEETEEETEKIIQDFYIGERSVIENFCEFIVYSIENYETKSEYGQPEEGFRLIALDVEIKNISNEMQSYDAFDYKAKGSDRYLYGCGFYENKEPYFGFGDISPGQTVRGWVTIPVKKGIEIVAIVAQPLHELPPIIIKLYIPLKP